MTVVNERKVCAVCGHDPDDVFEVNHHWPHHMDIKEYVTVDVDAHKREWVHVRPPRFYLHKVEEGLIAGKWIVIDRSTDLMVCKPYKHKKSCIKAFIRTHCGYGEYEMNEMENVWRDAS